MAYKQDWDWWRLALQHPDKIGTGPLSIHEGTPQSGFYRTRLSLKEKNAGERPEPVSIFQDDFGHYCANRGVKVRKTLKEADAVGSLWLRVCRNPIPHELYKSVMAGGLWPDEPPALEAAEKGEKAPPTMAEPDTSSEAEPASAANTDEARHGIGGNNPPVDEEIDRILAEKRAELAEEERLAAQFLAKPITTQPEADKASEWANRVARTGKWFLDEYWRINRPLVDRQNEIRRTLLQPSKDADALAQRLVRHSTDFLREQQRKADEAAAAARRAQEDALREAQRSGVPEESLPLAPVIQPARVTAGGATGRKTRLQKVTVGIVNDYVTFATFLITGGQESAKDACQTPDLKRALDDAANKIAKAGGVAPGMHSEEKSEARR